MKTTRTNITNWEAAASDRGNWRSVVKTGMKRENYKGTTDWEEGSPKAEISQFCIIFTADGVCLPQMW